MLLLATALAVTGCAPTRAVLEDHPSLKKVNDVLEGKRVDIRFTSGNRATSATSVHFSEQSIFYVTTGGLKRERPASEVHEVSYSRGYNGPIGIVVGVLPGAVLLASVSQNPPCTSDEMCLMWNPLSKLLSGGIMAAGGLIGAMIGSRQDTRVIVYKGPVYRYQ